VERCGVDRIRGEVRVGEASWGGRGRSKNVGERDSKWARIERGKGEAISRGRGERERVSPQVFAKLQ